MFLITYRQRRGVSLSEISSNKAFLLATSTLGTIQVLRQQRGGWVGSENGNFLLIYSTIYADVGGWVGLKKPKTC